jgi:hypothetical protein
MLLPKRVVDKIIGKQLGLNRQQQKPWTKESM